jgi:type VI secretion system protein ImpH
MAYDARTAPPGLSAARDFFEAMRALECAHPATPRVGFASLPSEEPLRLGQEPVLQFSHASQARIESRAGAPARVGVRFFGLFGPHGPLPLHLTELARERQMFHGDRTIARFLDLFHHRMLSLFYRVWAQARPHVQHDRPESDRFTTYVASIVGLGTPGLRDRDALGDGPKLYYAGLFAAHSRNAEGLQAIISDHFRVPTKIEQFVGEWLEVPARQCWQLGARSRRETGRLGRAAVLGQRVWQRQGRFRIVLGPLGHDQFQRFLPGREQLAQLIALVRSYSGDELAWDLELRLATQRPLQLGAAQTLGRTSWLSSTRPDQPQSQLRFDPQRAPQAEISTVDLETAKRDF